MRERNAAGKNARAFYAGGNPPTFPCATSPVTLVLCQETGVHPAYTAW